MTDRSRTAIALAVLALACTSCRGPASDTKQIRAAVALTAFAPGQPTVSIRDRGATGDGVTDDRAAIQAALDAVFPGEVVLVPNGTYLLGKGAGAWCLTVPAGVTLRGESRDGAVLLQAPGIAGSVRLLQIDAPGVMIETITLDGLRELQARDEHRAGVFVTAADVTIRGVTARAFTGDGFYFYTGADRFLVDDSDSTGNDRDGIAIGGASAGGRIRRSRFVGSRAQQFDSEPGSTGVISDLQITGCTFDGAGRSTDYAVTVSGGSSTARAHDWLIRGNVINGGLHAVWADRIVVRGNTGTNPTARPHVSFYRSCAGNVIEDNDLTSTAPNSLGTVNLTATGEGGPARTLIRRNRLVSDVFGLRAEGGVSFEAVDNDIVGPGVASPGAGIYLRATDPARPLAHAVIRRNRISNFGSVAVKVEGNGAAAIGLLDLTDNVLLDSAGTMLGAYRLNDGTGAAREIRESGTVMLGGCVTKLVGLAPAGALTVASGQRWVTP